MLMKHNLLRGGNSNAQLDSHDVTLLSEVT